MARYVESNNSLKFFTEQGFFGKNILDIKLNILIATFSSPVPTIVVVVFFCVIQKESYFEVEISHMKIEGLAGLTSKNNSLKGQVKLCKNE